MNPAAGRLATNSAFPPELLNNLIQETERKCTELKQAFCAAQFDLDESDYIMQELENKFDQLIEWSEIYSTAHIETKKMIVAQLIERVDVYRDYDLKIKLSICVEQFLIGLDICA